MLPHYDLMCSSFEDVDETDISVKSKIFYFKLLCKRHSTECPSHIFL